MTTCITTLRHERRARRLGSSPADIHAACFESMRAADEFDAAIHYARTYAELPNGHPQLKAGALLRLASAWERAPRAQIVLDALGSATELQPYMDAVEAGDEQRRAEQDREFAQLGLEQIRRVRDYDAANPSGVPGSTHVPQPDEVHALMEQQQCARLMNDERRLRKVRAADRRARGALHAFARRLASRRPACRQQSRQRSRSIGRASALKSSGGDSGDPEPEPPTTRHSAAIGGVL